MKIIKTVRSLELQEMGGSMGPCQGRLVSLYFSTTPSHGEGGKKTDVAHGQGLRKSEKDF